MCFLRLLGREGYSIGPTLSRDRLSHRVEVFSLDLVRKSAHRTRYVLSVLLEGRHKGLGCVRARRGRRRKRTQVLNYEVSIFVWMVLNVIKLFIAEPCTR